LGRPLSNTPITTPQHLHHQQQRHAHTKINSVGVLRHSAPAAGVVIEFIGGRGAWATRTYSAARNAGATLDGAPLSVSGVRKLDESLLATELCWQGDELWGASAALAQDFTRASRGLRMTGAAAANLCAVASGAADGYYQFMLKPW
jgi:myo-inositol-1(or 4)-monophosphatase